MPLVIFLRSLHRTQSGSLQSIVERIFAMPTESKIDVFSTVFYFNSLDTVARIDSKGVIGITVLKTNTLHL